MIVSSDDQNKSHLLNKKFMVS